MLVVGLTGGIATGKSTVSSVLKSHNVPIIDADIIARQVVLPGAPALRQIVKTFGPEVLLPDGSLDRKKLGSIIFPDEKKRKQLNSIVHPAVRRAMFWEVVKCWVKGKKWCVLDVPLLIEGPLWKLVGLVVVVYWCVELLRYYWVSSAVANIFDSVIASPSSALRRSSPETQLQRLMLRDNSNDSDASARLNSQIPITKKVEYADITIDNSGTKAELEEQVAAFIEKMNSRAGGVKWLASWLVPPVGVVSALWTLLWRNMFARRSKSE
ncbi:hypothetical protein D9756_010177 [Leucocoprinus leucothites]|uniref:Dephospho-CoA kinase n=1 Tax=Leucocoprinus leucothites TaxID=201217 RepID=A0A8H5FSX5_9AGAR|nr:hypothetical protein D9756_010177 [Leucoagaricus leucothites]